MPKFSAYNQVQSSIRSFNFQYHWFDNFGNRLFE